MEKGNGLEEARGISRLDKRAVGIHHQRSHIELVGLQGSFSEVWVGQHGLLRLRHRLHLQKGVLDDAIADYRRKELQEAELRFQQILGNLTAAQQTIERMSRDLPATEEAVGVAEKRRSWWPWRRE